MTNWTQSTLMVSWLLSGSNVNFKKNFGFSYGLVMHLADFLTDVVVGTSPAPALTMCVW